MITEVQTHRGIAGLTVGLGSVWVPCGGCPDATNQVIRIDSATNQIAASIDVPTAPSGHIAVGHGSVWLLDRRGERWISRRRDDFFQPQAMWLVGGVGKVLYRIDPDRNVVGDKRDLGGDVHALAIGETAVWVAKNDRLLKIDADTLSVMAEMRLELWPEDIAVTDGVVWVGH